MSFQQFAEQPVVYADESSRAAFLQRVALYTGGSLSIAAVSAVVSALLVLVVPPLQNQWVSLALIFGSFFVANNVARNMIASSENKMPGFILGSVAQGFAMGWLLLAAVMVSSQVYPDSPAGGLALIAQAGGLTGITALSMVVWLWSGPKDLGMVGAALRVLWLPMLILMVISFVFPIGGVVGILLSGAFVLVSGMGLVYQLNQVIHVMSTRQHVEAGYTISIGLLVLFWNILVLLMRLQSRD